MSSIGRRGRRDASGTSASANETDCVGHGEFSQAGIRELQSGEIRVLVEPLVAQQVVAARDRQMGKRADADDGVDDPRMAAGEQLGRRPEPERQRAKERERDGRGAAGHLACAFRHRPIELRRRPSSPAASACVTSSISRSIAQAARIRANGCPGLPAMRRIIAARHAAAADHAAIRSAVRAGVAALPGQKSGAINPMTAVTATRRADGCRLGRRRAECGEYQHARHRQHRPARCDHFFTGATSTISSMADADRGQHACCRAPIRTRRMPTPTTDSMTLLASCTKPTSVPVISAANRPAVVDAASPV